MSLQLVSNLSNEIETIADVVENLWFKQTRMGNFLSLKLIDMSVEGLDKREIRVRNDFDPAHATGSSGFKDQQNKTYIFLSKRGLLYLINKYIKPTHSLKILTDLAGVRLRKSKWLCKEQDTLRQIMKADNGEEMIHQFSVAKYRTDQYFLRYKLEIECEEFDHRDRDIEYEVG